MLIKDVIFQLEQLAPSFYAEDFDNTGLLVGNKNNSKMSLHNLSDKKPEVINYAKDKPDIVKHLLSLHKSWAEDVSPKSND